MKMVNKLIAVLMFGILSTQLGAMKAADEELKNELFRAAVTFSSVDKVRALLEQGVDPNMRNAMGYTLLYMVMQHLGLANNDDLSRARDLSIIRLLLENGIDLRSAKEDRNTDLMWAAWGRDREVVWLMLTVIPKSEHEKILAKREEIKSRINAATLTLKRKGVVKDVRRLIARRVFNQDIDALVDEQMHRIQALVNMKNKYDEGATTDALTHPRTAEIAALLDFNNPESYQKIRNEVRKNVVKIMFGGESRPVMPEKPHSNLEEQTVEEEDPFGGF